jgi:hypothetical protein
MRSLGRERGLSGLGFNADGPVGEYLLGGAFSIKWWVPALVLGGVAGYYWGKR